MRGHSLAFEKYENKEEAIVICNPGNIVARAGFVIGALFFKQW